MRKITLKDIEQKADFVSRYLDDYSVRIKWYDNEPFLEYYYGWEGSDIVAGPSLSDCNNHLNYLIRKMQLKDIWIEENR